ncbi:RNase H domain protein [Mycena pura]|uniref:ribonuclease H n=1 Tax=Mycena pura TaxID=153505 RepID=A0AAD6YDA9_9AGAR|nr:RNase H domain protein [Mycena pura]
MQGQAVDYVKSAMGNGSDGVWTGTTFQAPADTSPGLLFPPSLHGSFERFSIMPSLAPAVSRLETMMIYTDGACASNGLASPRGGFAFVFNTTPGGTVSLALEQRGPDHELHVHTSNRAELRAVIAALAFRAWGGERWKRVVVVTDSEYVGKGATTWMRTWAGNGWRTSAGQPVANRDLWEALSARLGDLARQGCEVSFWMVPRHWNTLADAAAKAGTEMESPEYFTAVYGAMI